jgi:hypothetical protein
VEKKKEKKEKKPKNFCHKNEKICHGDGMGGWGKH